MIEEQNGLHVRDLLKSSYEKLSQQHKNTEITFHKKALAEIGNDNDWHRTRVGYMGYENARAFEFNGKNLVIARGEKCGSYPADPYDSDILAFEFPLNREITESTKEEIVMKIAESSYFRNSLVYAMADGNLAVSERGRFGKQMLDLLKPRINDFIAQGPEYDMEIISLSTLGPFFKKSIIYKREFADFLAESFKTVLNNQ